MKPNKLILKMSKYNFTIFIGMQTQPKKKKKKRSRNQISNVAFTSEN